MRIFIILFLCGMLGVSVYYQNKIPTNISGIIAINNKPIAAAPTISIDTQFFIGSISKQVTAYLAITNIPDIDKYVSAYINESDWQYIKSTTKTINMNMKLSALSNIKIKHLLAHCSGYDFIKNIKRSEPGTRYVYDNANYIIIGKILEKITNKSFKTLCKDLFDTIGLSNTFLVETTTYSDLYTKDKNLQPAIDLSATPIKGVWHGISYSGGLVSTVRDLTKWCVFLEKNKIYKKLLSFRVPTAMADTESGLGVLYNVRQNIVWHHGVLPISNFYFVGALLHKPGSNITTVILENVFKTIEPKNLFSYILNRTNELIKKYF